MAPVDGVCSTDILVVETKIEKYYSYLVMKLFSKEIVDFATSVSTGTRMPRTNWNDISGYVIVLPIDPILDQFSKIVLPILKSFEKSIKENTSLLNIRDTLLPKLMSGEIRAPLESEGDAS
ncbi:restriction endonuclease subunit S domain-containing protein [Alkaliphilus metalliredigens]|uniref:hypothetical protein n=1 Tax=Alkaliphilus metalliredigens TaxID=208226 RepID=UPI00005CAD85|nr:hypothetical protein [Alkaliphilus metalliredigens]